MADRALHIVGVGPAGLDRLPPASRVVLEDEAHAVVVRTLRHPALAELAQIRDVVACDDLYDGGGDLETVYESIADRVLDLAAEGTVVYAVPGSASVGERTVSLLLERAAALDVPTTVDPGESFLDLVFARLRLDPLGQGVQVLDARNLPDPLPLHLPTIIGQVDRPVVLADTLAELGRVLDPDVPITVLDRLGDDDEVVWESRLGEAARYDPGSRTTLFLAPPPAGWHGLVTTNRRLRRECPWDRKQTHHTLVKHLIEETYETVEALERLTHEAPEGDVDFGDYAVVEEELGDLLLQVVFHATLAREAGAFDVEEVAETIRRKLVYRHPHVFGDAVAEDAEAVKANWERLKATEKQRTSALDDIPGALPAMARADKLQRRAAALGFDWTHQEPVVAKLHEELAELIDVLDDPVAARHELGDVLFAAVNLARHLDIDSELALRRANSRFERRFRHVEDAAAASGRNIGDMTLDDMDELWEEAKRLGT